MPRQWPISFRIFLMMCSLLFGYAGGHARAQANEPPLLDPCALITTSNMTNLIGQKVSAPIRSGMYDEGDHAWEYELSCGSGPIEIRAFPGDPWDRITKLHPNASSLSGVGGEALHPRTRPLGILESMSGKKCSRGNQHALLTLGRKIYTNHCTAHFEKIMRNNPEITNKGRPLPQSLHQGTHLWYEIPSPAGTA